MIVTTTHTPLSNENELTAAILSNEFELSSTVVVKDSMQYDKLIKTILEYYIDVENLIDNIIHHNYKSKDIFPEELFDIYYKEYTKIAHKTSEEIMQELLVDLDFVNMAINHLVNSIKEFIVDSGIEQYKLDDMINNAFGYEQHKDLDDFIDSRIEEIGTKNFKLALEKNPEYGIIPESYKESVDQEIDQVDEIEEIISLLLEVDPLEYEIIKEYIKGKT